MGFLLQLLRFITLPFLDNLVLRQLADVRLKTYPSKSKTRKSADTQSRDHQIKRTLKRTLLSFFCSNPTDHLNKIPLKKLTAVNSYLPGCVISSCSVIALPDLTPPPRPLSPPALLLLPAAARGWPASSPLSKHTFPSDGRHCCVCVCVCE